MLRDIHLACSVQSGTEQSFGPLTYDPAACKCSEGGGDEGDRGNMLADGKLSDGKRAECRLQWANWRHGKGDDAADWRG